MTEEEITKTDQIVDEIELLIKLNQEKITARKLIKFNDSQTKFTPNEIYKRLLQLKKAIHQYNPDEIMFLIPKNQLKNSQKLQERGYSVYEKTTPGFLTNPILGNFIQKKIIISLFVPLKGIIKEIAISKTFIVSIININKKKNRLSRFNIPLKQTPVSYSRIIEYLTTKKESL